jgi:hypothetical protein
MNTTQDFEALRHANPRARAAFPATVEAARQAVSDRIVAASVAQAESQVGGRRMLRLSTAGVGVVVVLAAVVAIGDFGGGRGVESATAAFQQAATLTAAAAERSGTADVRITHNGEQWAGSFIRWNGDDISIARERPSPLRKVGDEMRVVDGVLYGLDHRGEWLAMGSPRNIDPDSGTTPDEYLAAVRADVGGVTLQRFTTSMRGLTRTSRDDGSEVYAGTVAAGLIAPETGFKEGQAIRVFPFGYVAHDEAANPNSQLDVAVTVGSEGVVREIKVTWGTPASSWVYTVAYSALGATAAPAAPPNTKSLAELRGLVEPAAPSTP